MNQLAFRKTIMGVLISLGFLGALSLLYDTVSYELKQPIQCVELTQAMINPERHKEDRRYKYFLNGVVVFKKATEDISTLVVIPRSVIKATPNVSNLPDDCVMVVKVHSSDFKAAQIGSIVDLLGWMNYASNEKGSLYYIDARSVRITGTEEIDDPDFEKLVQIVSQKVSDEKFAMSMLFWFFIASPTIFSNSYYSY